MNFVVLKMFGVSKNVEIVDKILGKWINIGFG